MWPPQFRWVATLDEAADAINRPHEDYPVRVVRTADCLQRLMKHYREVPGLSRTGRQGYTAGAGRDTKIDEGPASVSCRFS